MDSQEGVLLTGWTQSGGGTAERVDSQEGVLLTGWTPSGGGTAERVDTVRERYC